VAVSDDTVLDVIDRFNDAWNRQDLDTMMALTDEDVVFESTSPPDGRRFEGRAAVRGAWAEIFRDAPRGRFDGEEAFVAGDRCTVRWRYTFDVQRPDDGHVRGVDVFRLRDGKIAEKLSYVKG
jgi:ketosteroid isomerase-like protein